MFSGGKRQLQAPDATSVSGQLVNFELDPSRLSDYIKTLREVCLRAMGD